jgi:uncharacterized protein
MHPQICSFISQAFYDGRVDSEPSLARQSLQWTSRMNASLPSEGIVCHLVDHEGCRQKSKEEANHIRTVHTSLIGQTFRDRHGNDRVVESNDILVVAPYNMQVELLKKTLGDSARVGTVDKFQGQEAPIVLVSMTTSSREDIPRHMDFLYSPNRLNVAISRARCLSVIVLSAGLFNVRCSTIEQMRLVNTLCWARQYSEERRAKIA